MTARTSHDTAREIPEATVARLPVYLRALTTPSQAGTTGEDYVRGKGFDPQSFENSQAELDGLRTGQVDVIVQDEPVVRYWLKDPTNSAYTVAASLQTNEQYGYAVRKGGNPALLKYINEAIAQAKRDGTYKRIYEKWMGPMPADALP